MLGGQIVPHSFKHCRYNSQDKCHVSLEAVMVRSYLCMQLAKRSGLANSPLSYTWTRHCGNPAICVCFCCHYTIMYSVICLLRLNHNQKETHWKEKTKQRHFTQLWITWQIHFIGSSLIILWTLYYISAYIYIFLPFYGIQNPVLPSKHPAEAAVQFVS